MTPKQRKLAFQKLTKVIQTLDFTDTECEAEARRLAHDFMTVGMVRVLMMRERVSLASDLELLKAKRDPEIRKELEEDGERVTESRVAACIRMDDEVKELNKRLDAVQVDEKHVDLLLDALRMKRYAISDVSRLVATEDAMGRMVSAEASKEALRKKARQLYKQR